MSTATRTEAIDHQQTLEAHDFDRMPGHWVLARMGKRVLRPGGVELTQWMLRRLKISSSDHVIELAPGLGRTAELALSYMPATYTAIDRDPAAIQRLRDRLAGGARRWIEGSAEATGLADGHGTVLYGEAFLTMQAPHAKLRILKEAARVLRPGGRYGIHEMTLAPDELDVATKARIQRDLAETIRVNARPLTVSEWKELLTAAGFEIEAVRCNEMALLELGRFVKDEGALGTARFVLNVLTHPRALKRILKMRAVFRKHARHLGSISIIAKKAAK